MDKEIRPPAHRGPSGSIVKSMLFFIVSVVLFVLVMVLKLHVQGRIFDLGYKICQASNKKRALLQEKKQMDLEVQYLRSPARINEVVQSRLDMKIPASDQIVHLRSSERKKK
jgi:cell division protein FtsL